METPMGRVVSRAIGYQSREAATPARRVLLAEDSTDVRELLKTALELDGYEVIGFPDGTSLVDYLGDALRPHADTAVPDIIITDIRMPGFSGIDVLAALRRADLQVPVILITAFGNEEIDAEARRLGAAGLFAKPFDIDDLRTALRYFLEHEPGETHAVRGRPERATRTKH
jgi:DNA-binding response OmpR family regulator